MPVSCAFPLSQREKVLTRVRAMLWNLVYAFYSLTPDEIRLVEEFAPSSARRAEPAPDSPPFA
jgi:hypothetical protein